ncbi:MAG TPA: DUF167 domain-containing protein [Myxococcaceae bacterium]|nr:DUF167 domain-containing protein [Myxococcaceae bacterium]
MARGRRRARRRGSAPGRRQRVVPRPEEGGRAVADLVREVPGGVELSVRAKPRASRPGLGAVRDGALDVRVSAAPVEGAANEALVELLARQLDVPRRAVSLVSGEHGRSKRVRIEGLTLAEVRARLGLDG